jgi:hypothetical protein
MYIVTSKPKRISLNAGLLQFMVVSSIVGNRPVKQPRLNHPNLDWEKGTIPEPLPSGSNPFWPQQRWAATGKAVKQAHDFHEVQQTAWLRAIFPSRAVNWSER